MKARDGDPVQYISDELDDPGLLEAVVEAPMNQAFMKQMSKQPKVRHNRWQCNKQ